jgi:hypothetical protein
METKHKIQKVIQQINRKLILLRTERKAANRKEIIDSIMLDEEGELHQLKELVGLFKE